MREHINEAVDRWDREYVQQWLARRAAERLAESQTNNLEHRDEELAK